jgi:Flp pilus assembly protein TadD
MVQLKYIPWVLGMLLTTACSQLVTKTSASSTSTEAEPVATIVAADNFPKQELTPEILYQFLLAEVAGQRGEIGLAKAAYLDLARKTKDPRLAQRAAEIAVFARDEKGALEATRLWNETDGNSERANLTLVTLLLAQDKLAEAEPLLKKIIAADAPNGFMRLTAWLGQTRDAEGALAMVQRLAIEYPMLPEAQLAIAQAASQANKPELVSAALQQADKLRPGWEHAALYRAQWLAKTSRADALSSLQSFLSRYPKARDVRLAYARLLVGANQFPEARKEFNRLTTDFPRNAEVSLAAGLLALQVGDAEPARGFLTQALEYGYKPTDTVHYYLGLVAEELKQPDVAAREYQQVDDGEYLVQARARQAGMLVKQGALPQARALLAATTAGNEAQRMRLIQAEAELLRGAKDYAQAYQVLSAGLKTYPDSPDLLYDQAMMAEKINKLDVLEANLRRVIHIKPDEAQAYNALGYTLADRTTRLDEAVELLDKALSLAPDDPFILDSMGWAQYRKGNFERARTYLDRAYKARPDPEIAAHLGEVLWAHGQRDDASTLWQSSLKTHPQNEVLQETLRRHKL